MNEDLEEDQAKKTVFNTTQNQKGTESNKHNYKFKVKCKDNDLE